MACSKTYGNIAAIVGQQIPRSKDDKLQQEYLQAFVDGIWYEYDWRESIKELPPIWLLPTQQTYGFPYYALPVDFLGLRQGYLVDTTTSVEKPYHRELKVIRDLREESFASYTECIGYDPATNTIKIHPVPSEEMCSPRFLINGTYKKKSPKLEPSTFTSAALPFDDKYYAHLISIAKYYAYEFSGMEEQATNQFPKMQFHLRKMAQAEGLEQGNPTMAPSEPLVIDVLGGYGGIGW